MTHGPPLGHGDQVPSGMYVGCADLLVTIKKRVKCKYHVFGHIHEGQFYIIIEGLPTAFYKQAN